MIRFSRSLVFAAGLFVASTFALRHAEAAPPATSFPFAIVTDNCSAVTIAANWITPVNGQTNVLFFVKDLKTQAALSASDAVDPNETSTEHEFVLNTLPKGKHKLFFSVQVRVGTAPIIGVEKTISVGCSL